MSRARALRRGTCRAVVLHRQTGSLQGIVDIRVSTAAGVLNSMRDETARRGTGGHRMHR